MNPTGSNPMFSATRAMASLALAVLAESAVAQAEDTAWVKMFNGKDLEGWTHFWQKKGISNPNNMFRVTNDGLFEVNITENFADVGYGHSFYTKEKLSYYIVRAEYRFPDNKYGPGWGQGWNMENNGLMLHSQAPETMNDKEFPESIEVQLLGKNNEQNGHLKDQGFKYATTANLCTPDTYVAYNGNDKYTAHCTAAQYPNAWKNTEIPFDLPDGWTDVTVRVLADSLVQHFIHGQKVFEYTKLRKDNGQPLKEGFLSIQAEGTNTQFRKLDYVSLIGCMTQGNSKYKSYFVKHDPGACATTGLNEVEARANARLKFGRNRVTATGKGKVTLIGYTLDGKELARITGQAPLDWALPKSADMSLIRVVTNKGSFTEKAAWF